MSFLYGVRMLRIITFVVLSHCAFVVNAADGDRRPLLPPGVAQPARYVPVPDVSSASVYQEPGMIHHIGASVSLSHRSSGANRTIEDGNVEINIGGASAPSSEVDLRNGAEGNSVIDLRTFFTPTIYELINESPNRKLFQQMNIVALRFLSEKQEMVEAFEIAEENFKSVAGSGISGTFFPISFQTFRRLGLEGEHPLALERFADLSVYAAQVKMEKDMMCSMFCIQCDRCSTIKYLDEAIFAYRFARDAYLTTSVHYKLLTGKIEDAVEVRKNITSRYCSRTCFVYLPAVVLIVGIVLSVELIFNADDAVSSAPVYSPLPSFHPR